MSIFKNKTLAEIDAAVPAGTAKMRQVLLFALLESFLDGKTPPEEFVRGISLILE